MCTNNEPGVGTDLYPVIIKYRYRDESMIPRKSVFIEEKES
jgi:hypothetical protein